MPTQVGGVWGEWQYDESLGGLVFVEEPTPELSPNQRHTPWWQVVAKNAPYFAVPIGLGVVEGMLAPAVSGAVSGGAAGAPAAGLPTGLVATPTVIHSAGLAALGTPAAAAATGTAAAAATGGGLLGGMSAADWIMTGLGIGGTVLDVMGNLKAGQAAKEVAEFNARVADMQAADALARGAEDEARFRQQVEVLVGSQRAGFAGQGVVVDYGSAADVVRDARYLGEQDARQIRRNAEREAWGHRMNAEGFRLGGEHAVTASKWNAAGSVLSGATSLIGARYGFGR